METDRIARGLIERTLPMRAGLWHLLRHPDDIALALMRERIRAYNESTGGENTDTAGYHETITRFYLRLIRVFLDSVDGTRPVDELANALIERCGERDLVLRHYSHGALFSTQARRGWLEPDLAPLPGHVPR